MTTYEMGKYWLLGALETYRDEPADAPKRAFINHILKTSQRNAGNDETEKRYHNLIILRYITDTRLSVYQICKALHIGRQRENYEAVTANAIDRLLVIAFGFNGINWLEQ